MAMICNGDLMIIDHKSHLTLRLRESEAQFEEFTFAQQFAPASERRRTALLSYSAAAPVAKKWCATQIGDLHFGISSFLV